MIALMIIVGMVFFTPTKTQAISQAPGKWFPSYSACACPVVVHTCTCVYLD